MNIQKQILDHKQGLISINLMTELEKRVSKIESHLGLNKSHEETPKKETTKPKDDKK